MNIAIKIHDSFLLFQRKRRFIALSYGIAADRAGASLSFAEESILQLLNSHVQLSIKELSERIGLEHSWTSRIVQGLLKRNLIESKRAEHDKRAKTLEVKPAGIRALKDLREILRKITLKTLHPLDKQEQEAFTRFTRKFANGLEAPEIAKNSEHHPLHLELGRISRALGVFGSGVLGSKFTNTQMQILECIRAAKTPVLATEIDEALPFDFSTISRAIKALEEIEILDRTPSKADKRSFHVVLTSFGKQRLQDYRKRAKRVFSRGLADFSPSECGEYLALLRKITALYLRTKIACDSELEFRACSPKKAIEACQNLQKDLHSIDSEVYELRARGKLIGFVALNRGRERAVKSLSLAATSLTNDEYESIRKIAFESSNNQ